MFGCCFQARLLPCGTASAACTPRRVCAIAGLVPAIYVCYFAIPMIELSEQDGIAVVRMADGKANAMSREFCEAFIARFQQAQAASRAVVITGTGNIFSAGVDLMRLADDGPEYIRTFVPLLNAAFMTVFGCDKPVVAAINGHAIAGGCVLACAADHRVMRRDVGLIGITELLVGVPFPPIAMEIMRCAMAPQFLSE